MRGVLESFALVASWIQAGSGKIVCCGKTPFFRTCMKCCFRGRWKSLLQVRRPAVRKHSKGLFGGDASMVSDAVK